VDDLWSKMTSSLPVVGLPEKPEESTTGNRKGVDSQEVTTSANKSDTDQIVTAEVLSTGAVDEPKKDNFDVTFEGEKYNIRKFLDSHPGGVDVLLPFEGKDITEKFHEVGHSGKAMRIMNKFRVNAIGADGQKIKHKVNPSYVFKKLFTPEDEYLIHKSLGLLCLCSYFYRYFYVLPREGNLAMNGSLFDHLTLLLHFLLSSSSLIFHVLKARQPTRPLIIYEEYRLHAIVFTLRTCLVSLVGFYCQTMEVIPRRFVLAGVFVACHLLVDRITAVHGTKGVTAVRNDGVLTFKYLGLFYSFYQMAALGSSITWNSRVADLGFNALVAIQSSAFLMTLKRKNLIRWYSHAFWYSLALALSYYVMYRTLGPRFFVYPALLFSLRARFNINKYVLWSVYVVSLYYFEVVK